MPGLWLTPLSWERWVERYRARGLHVLAPAWPGMEGDIDELRRAPLLLMAGGRDHTVPASVTKANYKLFATSRATTEYKEYPDRTHWTIAQDGWEQVADDALDWALAHAVGAGRAKTGGAASGG